MTNSTYRNTSVATYKICKIQDVIEEFHHSDEDRKEILLGERKLTSVRGSFEQAIKSMRIWGVKMQQKNRHLYIVRKKL